MKLMTVNEFRQKHFAGEARPDPRTIRSMVLRGDLPGRQIGRRVFIDVDRVLNSTGNELADKILQGTT